MLRIDFENLQDGDSIILHPSPDNPIHSMPVKATFAGGYFYCEGTPLEDGPDYYFGDVLRYVDGFSMPVIVETSPSAPSSMQGAW
jgi:hypothetical protein